MSLRTFFLSFVLTAPCATSWAMDPATTPQPGTPAAPKTAARVQVKKLSETELIALANKLRTQTKKCKNGWPRLEQLAEIVGLPVIAGVGTWAFFSDAKNNSKDAQIQTVYNYGVNVTAEIEKIDSLIPRFTTLKAADSPSEPVARKSNSYTKSLTAGACALILTSLMFRTLYKWYITNYADQNAAMTLTPAELLQILKNPNARKRLPKPLMVACDSLKKRRFNQRIDQLMQDGIDYETARQTAWNEELELSGG